MQQEWLSGARGEHATPPSTAGTETAATEAPGATGRHGTAAGAGASIPAAIATDIGVTEDTITVGMLADLSGAFAPLVTEIVEAQQVYWDAVNADGGIAGRQVELIIEDNAYDVPTHLEKYEIDPRQRGDHQPVDRLAAHGGDRRAARRGRPRRHPADVVLGVARSRLRAERCWRATPPTASSR